MEHIEFEPNYSTIEMPGKCLKCLAEREYGFCLRELLRGREDKETQERFEVVVSFLKSPELLRLRDESEKYLAEGKKVKFIIHLGEGDPKYELKVS